MYVGVAIRLAKPVRERERAISKKRNSPVWGRGVGGSKRLIVHFGSSVNYLHKSIDLNRWIINMSWAQVEWIGLLVNNQQPISSIPRNLECALVGRLKGLGRKRFALHGAGLLMYSSKMLTKG
ncbi:hypothetical protein AVEN_146936-1 [Araneus ventricosus]|uniref:Uncharacterized protein n=1 Tax=Araneus ventricosus TaxID=182803 RepID=A0A4Y2M255_ARAVE|nr:hypothetical protein AVEN_146936-1 [Araneus ventricosus]